MMRGVTLGRPGHHRKGKEYQAEDMMAMKTILGIVPRYYNLSSINLLISSEKGQEPAA